jgi:hypothetical protein
MSSRLSGRISFYFEAREVNRLDTRKLSQDIPVVLGNSHRFKTYFCFGHAPLWQRLDQQSKVPKVSQVDIEGIPVHDKPLFPIDMAYSRHMPSFTAEQATAARAFLGWSRHELGAASGLSFETVRDFEYDIQSATTKSVEQSAPRSIMLALILPAWQAGRCDHRYAVAG